MFVMLEMRGPDAREFVTSTLDEGAD